MARARRFRHRVTLSQFVENVDSHGQATKSWTPRAQLWAEIKPTGAGERTEGDRTQGDRSHTVSVRFDPDLTITTANRFEHEGRCFEVLGVYQEHEDRRTTVANCRETVA